MGDTTPVGPQCQVRRLAERYRGGLKIREVHLTCASYEGTDSLEEPDVSHNTLPIPLDEFDVEKTRENLK